MGVDPRGLAMAMGDAEARLNAVREFAEAQRAKAAALDAVVTHQRDRIRELEAALRTIAAYDDNAANLRLASSGSYGAFDEPGAVQTAREALDLTAETGEKHE